MSDRRYNLEVLDHLDVPDLWPGIEHQDVDSGSKRGWPSTVVGDSSARRRFTSAIVALVVAVAGTLLVVRALSPLGSHPGNASSWPGGTNVLSIPPAGTAVPAFLADGSPVFVVTTQQGSTYVLSAVSTHNPWGINYLIGWCPASQTFEDPFHGSIWGAAGAYEMGPAPTGLVPYDFTVLPGGELRVGMPLSAPRRGGGVETPIAGPICDAAGGTPGMTLLRVEPSAIWPSPEATVRAAPTAWIAVRGRLVVTASSAKLCPGSDPGCRDGALVFGLDTKGLMARQRQLNGPDTYTSGSRIWLAHVQGSGLVDLTAATGYTS